MKKSMLAAILAGIVLFVAGCCDCEDLTDGIVNNGETGGNNNGNNGNNGGNVGNIDPALVGIWNTVGHNTYYVFNSDGTGIFYDFDNETEHQITNFEWETINNNLYIFYENNSFIIEGYITKGTKFYTSKGSRTKTDKLPF